MQREQPGLVRRLRAKNPAPDVLEVLLTEGAERDFEELYDYIAEFDLPDNAEYVLAQLKVSVNRGQVLHQFSERHHHQGLNAWKAEFLLGIFQPLEETLPSFEKNATLQPARGVLTMSDKTSLDARSALQELKDGYQRYATGNSRITPEWIQEQIKAHADGQQPFGIVLACADSRVPPQTIFDQDIGDLFVLRVAGNVADGGILGSIQYAIEHLGTKLIVVLGHERCGAIQAALSVAAKKDSFSGPLGQLVSGIVPLVEPVYRRSVLAGLAYGDATVLDNAVRVNVKRQAAIIRDVLENLGQEKLMLELWLKHILVVGARYDLDDGTVEFFEEPTNDRPKRIGLLAENGYGVAVAADGTLLARDGQSVDEFEIHDGGEGRLALKTIHGLFLSATGDGVAATESTLTAAARFRLLDLGDRQFALQDFQGRYLSLGLDGRIATSAEAHGGEYFRIVQVDE